MAPGRLENGWAMLEWGKLEGSPPLGERLTTRLAFPHRRKDLFIAIDSRRQRHFLVNLHEGDDDVFERPSKGISVSTIDLNVGGGNVMRFIDIVCLESYGHPALDIVAREIAEALNAGASIHRSTLIRNVLAKWKRFWTDGTKGILSRSQQVGLFGELWFLRNWLIPVIGEIDALQSWRGPFGARNDFESPRIAVEVKATTSSEGRHRINGLEQLVCPEHGQLLLFSLIAREEHSSVIQLPGLIAEIRTFLGTSEAARTSFEESLEAAGYLDIFANEYKQLKLRVRSESLYRIGDGFPRILPDSFSGGLPTGVANISYELSLDAAKQFRLAETPAEAQFCLEMFRGARQ